jgi:hypothetical protein
MSSIEDSLRPTFGGHEKFVFRYGWLKKGVDALSENSAIFTDDKALIVLGVGKNMVRSIRHWCLAAGLFEETRGKGPVRGLQLTDLANRFVTDGGWDPYLEDTGTLWLLHWQLASNLTRTLIWHLTFCAYYEAEFTKKQLVAFMDKQLDRRGISTTSGTIEREIDVCLRTYVTTTRRATAEGISEETLDCPLAELDLIRFLAEDSVYRFNIGPKATLPTEVFGYALLTFLSTIVGNRRTVAVDECLYRDGSPGQVFKLDENSVIEHLEALEQLTEGRLRLQETAGLRQLYLEYEADGWFRTAALDLLGRHYARSGN